MQHNFERVAIVNRGEAAMRFIHAAREYNRENGTRLATIALYTEPDRHAMFVREADEAVCLGAAQVIDQISHHPKSSYVDYQTLERALTAARADAAWVGWGFVAEHAAFADLCRDLAVVFIGPDGEAMRRLGDKITSKLLAEAARIPVAPWSGGPVETVSQAEHEAAKLGFPLLIKATAGGGGHGIRLVQSASELPTAFERARAEAFKAFGDPTVFLEQLVGRSRHIEVQVIADHYGNTWAVGVRDCTIQRRHQKILEEAPSPALSPAQDEELRQAAVRLTNAAGYTNAGTVEFLYEPELRRFSFMEMNTRLQVEHPVTEATTGLDLVKLQIHVARGGRLEGEAPRSIGHAIEVRLNAEDADNGFAPAPGTIERFRFITGPGIRIDTGVGEGDCVPADFDSMMAKIIAHGQTRKEALARLERTLRDCLVIVKGGSSNRAFLLELLRRPEVENGDVDVGWLDRLAADGEHISHRHAEAALVQAAIEAYAAELSVEQAQFYAAAHRGRPQVRNEIGRNVELRYRGHSYSLQVRRLGLQQYHVESGGARVDAQLERLGDYEYWLTAFGQRSHVVSALHGLSYRIEVNGVSHRIDRDEGGVVHAPAPAVVVSILVAAGDRVSGGQPVVVLEAMKMEMQVTAPFSGRVRNVMVIPYVQVDTGAPLVQLDPIEEEEVSVQAERIDFSRPAGAPSSVTTDKKEKAAPSRCRENLEELRQLMLGFDIEPRRAARLVAECHQRAAAPEESEQIQRLEEEILEIFADICSLFGRHPAVDRASGGEAPSAEAHLFAYLRMLERQGEGLPADFLEALRRALAHYGVHLLERSRELEEAMLWIYKSHQRMEQQAVPVLAVLERQLARAAEQPPHGGEPFRKLLDRVIAITRGRFPAISDVAREVRYRCFDQPLFERARGEVYRQVEGDLAALASHPDSSDRHERIRALTECPQPLVGLFCRRFQEADPASSRLMLEVLTWRYYRIRDLTEFSSFVLEDRSVAAAEYDFEGRHIHAFTTHCLYTELCAGARSLESLIAGVPPEHDVVVDFYTAHGAPLADPDVTEREVRAMLNQAGFPRPMRRVVVVAAGPGDPLNRVQPAGGLQQFTYRQSGGAFEEDKFYRSVHPMMGKRLHLWRLENFAIERLPSVEDVYLIHGVARENPKDERLFACAEVRDLTAVRDEIGRLVALPHLERMFGEAAAAMRHFQARRPERDRLYWNRILLYVWPPLTISAEEMRQIAYKLAPAAEGLGLEQVVVKARIPVPETGDLREMIVRISSPAGSGLLMTFRPAGKLQPLKPLDEYTQKVVRMRQRGLEYPYEIIRMLTPALVETRAEFPPGYFVEHDFDAEGRLVAVKRPYGRNTSNIITGVICNFTPKYPEGMSRVILLGDPSKDLGALAEPECRRILAALDLAAQKGLPVEWFALSAGAKISMDSGVENMDWIARVLRRLVEFTQAGGEVNIIVDGINVGAQPYWNAEATMLMHTRGILVMTSKAAMVLTGKRALDYSGSVSAEDNQGIGGYDRVMGPNGQSQYYARDIDGACHILFRHYEHTYVVPGERFPRKAVTVDPIDRDVRGFPHDGPHASDGFSQIGEVFSDETNPGRKRSFDIRKVMLAVVDQDHKPLERWAGMRAAECAVVWDAHLGGFPVCLIGIESRPLSRLGFVPADGPDQWTAGTLFPHSSKKVARAINAASNNRPVVMLANLSGFDGSPESLRRLQLEYGAEIGRAVVNFKGPMVFCVISRYHGGAYVVFSRVLNEGLQVAALEGTYASVIGGAPAAAVVFSREVDARTRKDPRLRELSEALAQAESVEKSRLHARWNEVFNLVRSEKLGQLADEFDSVHSVHRALRVGALNQIIPPGNLRPFLIESLEQGMRRYEGEATAMAHG
jgi:acetyl/propionyl-CoA carboxylase alpha subunit/acetyl-CoA carboxylase carboxyltransferase component